MSFTPGAGSLKISKSRFYNDIMMSSITQNIFSGDIIAIYKP